MTKRDDRALTGPVKPAPSLELGIPSSLAAKLEIRGGICLGCPSRMPTTCQDPAPPSFVFERDTFAFSNELVWEYQFTGPDAPPVIRRRHPAPAYAHRCFVLVRAARQFLYHAEFQPDRPPLAEPEYRQRIRRVLRRNPRTPCPPDQRVVFPGYEGLRTFSQVWAPTLKAVCGGAWRSYVLRSHWRMVFPISRRHQEQTAARLTAQLAAGRSSVVHLVRFPQLTINHGILVCAAIDQPHQIEFRAYDPNQPAAPVVLTYDRHERQFVFPANPYWPGGGLDVIEIFARWWM